MPFCPLTMYTHLVHSTVNICPFSPSASSHLTPILAHLPYPDFHLMPIFTCSTASPYGHPCALDRWPPGSSHHSPSRRAAKRKKGMQCTLVP
eukprot:1162151-Pelagomonas_calceolata.AAC.4